MNLNLRWDDGQLGWYDPATGQRIATFDNERSRADSERPARLVAEKRADAAEARAERASIRELEAELRRRDSAP